MAYTSVIPVHRLKASVEYVLDKKKTSRGQNAKSLEEAVGHALNRSKTEQDLFESAIACTCETAFEDMCRIKEMWHKTGGVQGFHLVQSFAAGEVTCELAHQIGLEFAGQLLQGRYQAVVSTHLNTGHIHNHIVWNSVSIQDGKKYRSNAKSYYTEVRAKSDALCRKYGLSVIESPEAQQGKRQYAKWKAEQENRPTWKTAIQQDIDAVVGEVFTWSQFLSAMENRGYTLRLNRKYITLQPPGKERPVRFKTLGKDYTPDAICRRILYPQRTLPQEKVWVPMVKVCTEQRSTCKLTGLQALYFSYLYQVGVLPHRPRFTHYAVREDIRKLDQRIEQIEFIFQHGIENREQLKEIEKTAQTEIESILEERYRLYRREDSGPRIQEIGQHLRELRHTVKLCKRIEEHSLAIEQSMYRAQQQVQREEKRRELTIKEKERSK